MTTAITTTEAVSVGNSIREARAALGIGMRELAGEVYTSPGHMAAIESGHRYPGVELVRRLADRLGLDADYLVAACGRVSPAIEDYMKAHPLVGILLRKLVLRGVDDELLAGLISSLDHPDREADAAPFPPTREREGS